MAENFLEEQLKRIREMTEQMSRARNSAAEVSEEVRRDRALIKRSPLHDVKDFRRYSSIDERPASAGDHGARSAPRHPRHRRK